MKNKKKSIVVGLFVLGIVLITTGATVAWFSYSKTGLRENSITSGSITFHYDEKSQGLTLPDAVPMTDAQGMAQNTYFEFDVTSRTSSTVEIPYEITVRRSGTGTNMDNVVKVYLTKMVGNVETPVEIIEGQEIVRVSELTSYINSSLNIDSTKNEKKLITETVPVGSNNYKETYRLRIWMSTDAQYLVQENGVDTYPYQGKTYNLQVNVYARGEEGMATVTASDIDTTTSGVSVQDKIDELAGLLN